MDCAARVQVHARRTVRRKIEAERQTEGGRLQKTGDSRAARCIGLQHVNGTGLEHPPEITGIVAVLSCRDLQLRGRRSRSSRSPSRSSEETGSSNQLAPRSANTFANCKRLLAAISAIGVDKKFDIRPDSLHAQPGHVRDRHRDHGRLSFSHAERLPRPNRKVARSISQAYEVNPPLP